jgi:uncharacterized MnhB-related membrane protein
VAGNLIYPNSKLTACPVVYVLPVLVLLAIVQVVHDVPLECLLLRSALGALKMSYSM